MVEDGAVPALTKPSIADSKMSPATPLPLLSPRLTFVQVFNVKPKFVILLDCVTRLIVGASATGTTEIFNVEVT